MIYILWLCLFQLYEANFNVINEMTRYSSEFLWNEDYLACGVISKYIPLGSKYYLFPDPTKKFLFFIQSYKSKETNQLFYLVYLEVPAVDEQQIKIHILYNENNNWNEFEFVFDKFNYEGRWIQQYVYYYEEIKKIVVEVSSGLNEKQTGYIPYQSLINKTCIVTIGGSLNYIHPITNEELIMQTLPGKLYVGLQVTQDEINQFWEQPFDIIECSDAQNLLLNEQIFDEPEQNQIYTISQFNQKYYKISFWCIISNDSISDQDEEINIIRVTANKFTSDFLQSGSNSFVLKYIYNSQEKIWSINVEYYSYLTPLIFKFKKNHDPYQVNDQIELSDIKYITSWHFILIEYNENHILQFYFQNVQENFEFIKYYENVQQFSNIYYRLFFGGSPLETSSMPRSFALISFYICYQETVKCHYSCQTCYGPLLNQCQSCNSTQNRYFDSEQEKCLCFLWYKEGSDGSCSFATQDGVTISIKNDGASDLETFDEFCQFGQFSYDEQCFSCPSAKQKTSVICSECLMRPIDWISKNQSCMKNFYLFNNNANNNFIELEPDNQKQNLYFLFQNEQLIPCEGCKICYVLSATCQKSDYYNHINKETFIECLAGFEFENGICKPNLPQKVLKCSFSCKKCSQTSCLSCKKQYFLNLFGQCQLCSIQFCKLCFQFNPFDHVQNTIFQDIQTFNEQNEDSIVGCALCEQGHFYSFLTQQCIKDEQYSEFNFFMNDISDKNYYQTNLGMMYNEFQEIINCSSIIPNCKTCIYNNLHLIVCSQCDDGYFLNIKNGMCSSCSLWLGQNVEKCIIESNLEISYKFRMLGFSQYFSQQYLNYFNLTSQLNQLLISTCKNNMIRNTITNQCLENCQNCDQCQFLFGQTQCLRCTQLEHDQFYSQQAGKCYSCPYPCKFCLPLDFDIIQKYNPYFVISEESINQAKKCLVNFDDRFTFINSKSGLIQPFDDKTKEKKQFYVESQIPISSVEEGEYILSTSSQTFFEFLFTSDVSSISDNHLITEQNVYSQMLNIFYSLNKATFSLFPGEQLWYDYICYNVTNFILQDLLYQSQSHSSTLQLISQYGINVEIKNVSIYLNSEQFLYIFNLTKLTISNFQFFEVKVRNSYVIQIDNCIQNTHIEIVNLSLFDSTFQNSSFINVTSENIINVNLYNLSFINCNFNDSQIINFDLFNQNSNLMVKKVNFLNCTVKNSILFQLNQTINQIIFSQIQILDTNFSNSNLVISKSSITFKDAQMINLRLSQSIIFFQTFNQPQQNVHYSNIILKQIQFLNSNLISLSTLSQLIYFNSIIENFTLDNLTEILNMGQIKYFIFIQNSNIQLQNVSISNQNLLQFLKFQNCLKVRISNLFFNGIFAPNYDFSKANLVQNSLIYIQEFEEVYFNSIHFQNINQHTDPLIQIRANDNQQKIILIEQLQLINYSTNNSIKSLNSAIFISTQAVSIIKVTNCVFSSIIFKYEEPNSDIYTSSVMKIQSTLSNVFIGNTLFSDVTVFNSSESIIMVEASSLIISFISVENFNSKDNNNRKSMVGFCVILAQSVLITNSNFKNIYSILYGIIFIQLKQYGVVNLQNCIFEKEDFQTNIIPQFGGVIGINGEFAQLNLFFKNLTAKYFLTQECCAFFYLIPSQLQNKIVLENINLLNLFSTDRSIGQFLFQQNVENNTIEISNLMLNNLLMEVKNDAFSLLIHSQPFNSSNTQGLLSLQKCNVKFKNFSFIGQLYSPILQIMEANVVLIKNVIFYQMTLAYDLSFLIKLQGIVVRKLLLEEIQIENFQTLNTLKSFIVIDFLFAMQPILISNLIMKNISCEKCQSGLLLVQFIGQQQKIKLQSINILQSNCGKFSCLQFFNSQGLFDSNKYLNLTVIDQGVLNLQNSSVIFKNLIIKNCKCLGNAGALFMNKTNISGKAFANVNNSADIGAGIYMQQSKLSYNQLLQIMFYENNARTGLNNVREFPDSLVLKMYNVSLKTKRNHFNNYTIDTPLFIVDEFKKLLENLILKVKSGQKIGEFEILDKTSMQYKPNKIQLQLEQLTQLGEQVIDSSQQKCFISQKSISLSNTSNNSNQFSEITESIFDNQAVIYYNQSTQTYQLDDIILYLDPYLDSNLTLIVQVQCETLDSNYFYYFMAKTIPCSIGEYFHINGQNTECLQCDYGKGYFSVEKNSSECQRQDPKKILKVSSSTIELQNGFWRYSFYSHYIEECDIKSRCLGGSQVNFNSCEIGYIGAICKECDLYNIRGNGQFMRSLNGECQQFKIQSAIIILTTFLMIFILYITYQVGQLKMKMQNNFKTLKGNSIHYKILFKCNLDDVNARLKQLIRLSQITLQVIVESTLPINLSHLYWPIAKSQTTLQNLVYYVVQNLSIQIIYLKAIWTVLIPFIQTIVLTLLYILVQFFRKRKIDWQIIQFFCYFLSFYSIPSIIEEFSQLLQQQQLGNISWVGANVSFQYYTQEHQNWVYFLILPGIIFFGVIIPFLILLRVMAFQNQKFKNITNGIFGYLCSDYKVNFFLWEVFSFQLLLVIVFTHYYFEHNLNLFRYLVIFIILFIYYVLISIFNPFIKNDLNEIEKRCIFSICILTSISCLLSSANEDQITSLNILTDTIIIITLIFIIGYNILGLLSSILKKNDYLIDFIVKFCNSNFPNFANQFIQRLNVKRDTRNILKQKIQLIKNQLKNIKKNKKSLKHSCNNSAEDTSGLTSNLMRSEQRVLLLTFPQVQQSIFL